MKPGASGGADASEELRDLGVEMRRLKGELVGGVGDVAGGFVGLGGDTADDVDVAGRGDRLVGRLVAGGGLRFRKLDKLCEPDCSRWL
ncbi:hypothetical protein [Bosea sp. NBC_00550]|uniref:hypothetical protein n=1 Tax=Bosea sp. NBC_00550 TaxID=2969621 RepID=UPI002230F72D|nr:hypothetical protein [Bosea sp. NBC_00550]UZF94285.1 hypothetical protein NWE53_08905 [Bosea sp. NBC_00550]